VGSFVITLREGFEAALIISMILAYLAKTGSLEHRRTVWLGVAAAIVFSLAMGGILFATIGELEGSTEQLYEGLAMMIAAGVVTWMVFWMKKQAATIGEHLRSQVGDSLRAGGGFALAMVAFIGVAREGIETGLFLFASTEQSGAVVSVTAAVLGLLAAVVLGVLFFRGALRLDLKQFFRITGVLVIVFAGWLIFNGLHEFGELAESEALEMLAPVAALAYIGSLTWIYLRGLRTRHEAPTPAAAGASAEA
jgi:high-affinity iron transporter